LPTPRRLLAELEEYDRVEIDWSIVVREREMWHLLADVLEGPPAGVPENQ
jgi:hypothetical protein